MLLSGEGCMGGDVDKVAEFFRLLFFVLERCDTLAIFGSVVRSAAGMGTSGTA